MSDIGISYAVCIKLDQLTLVNIPQISVTECNCWEAHRPSKCSVDRSAKYVEGSNGNNLKRNEMRRKRKDERERGKMEERKE